jgi:2-oxoglutarate ferredoxin oxidoreductase subunit beta
VLDLRLYQGREKPTWCPGCGDYGILAAVKNALAELEIPPHRALIVSGIGCGSKLPHYMKVNGFHGIHGRALPIATGAKLANHELTVLVVAGDGDSYGIGGNHLVHACRRNPDITHLVQDNRVYGLTKGQYSPTSERGFLTVTSPEGSVELAVNPLALAIAAGAGFVARGYVGDLKHLMGLIVRGVKHKGYALIDILQPCVTFNRVNTYEFYNERVYRLEETDHDPRDRLAAFRKALEWGDRIPIGLFYREERPTHEEGFPALRAGPLVERELKPTAEEFAALKAEFL